MSPVEGQDKVVIDARKYELQELFVAGVQGDSLKYADFLKLTARLLRPALKRKVPVSDVDDVIQEILSSIHRSRHTYDDNRPILPWIFSIAHFRVTDYLRKIYANRRSRDEIERLAWEAVNVTLQPSASESVDEHLDELPISQQKMLRSLYFEGLSARETAAKIGMGESAVKTAVHRVLKKLRLSLNGEI